MDQRVSRANEGKFVDPATTADGSARATVALTQPTTLWFNTGTLCNIACEGCYIESSPTNDALAYMTRGEVAGYLDQINQRGWPVREIGFTGGEPFMNPDFPAMLRDALSAGYSALVLTNAMTPMLRPLVRNKLAQLIKTFGDKLTLRVSLDHWTAEGHDEVRGPRSFEGTMAGLRFLAEAGARIDIAGRARWKESEAEARAGYAALFDEVGLDLDASDPARLVIFPEMDTSVEVPEITTACWSILDKSPDDVMCASSRMVVKRKGRTPSVVSCTLLPYEDDFDLGPTLADAEGPVALNHPHCAKFCVLGGASCSG
ncbi:radical SAM protein [Maritimibacter sp. UBA3975]|uniref:radical SAM protein n=1 Tax=Maritimibacter sp. UBA3975 TaxID=1946833 RepID=UPI000C0ADF88|nr:radical SAM protein [Maritimibacter sp. UBA3975]MAM60336.1 radical SAM protein [Maritimibacter sp.]|tara:strand:+ start:7410 stop:8357 length:948 start_codon:yes stop_codon:yes gene_type:complete